jgi:hypothetical protein
VKIVKTNYKIVRLMGAAGRSARIFQDWLESQDIVALANEKEVVMTTNGPIPMRNCAVFPAEMAERVAEAFNQWIADRECVVAVNITRTPEEFRKGISGSKRKEIKMFVGGIHKPRAFTQNWKP